MSRPVAGLVLAAALTLAGCASASSTTAATSHATAPVTGTETLAASVTGKAAAANLNSNSNAPLTFGSATLTGPVPATIRPFTLTGNGNKGTVSWATTAGKLTVYHASAPGYDTASNAPLPATWTLTGRTCHFTATFSKGTFKQVGAFGTSTAWHGDYVVTAVGYALLAKGKTACSFTSTGAVEASGAGIRFAASGPMTT